MSQADEDSVRVYHVDWDKRELVSIEEISTARAEMPEQGVMFEHLLSAGDTILTVFSTAHPHNRLPEALLQFPVGTLKWNKNYSIPDFGFDESGVYGNLSFNSKPHFVYISWSSLLEMTGTASAISKIWSANSEGLDKT